MPLPVPLAIPLAALLLLWPALWNGWPLVFSDTAERKQTRSSLLTIRRALLLVAVRLTRSGRYIHVWLEGVAVAGWKRMLDRLGKRLARQAQQDTLANTANAPP